jgi:CheY-like chemotaxis protein
MADHPKTILCVDDEKNILQALKRLLRTEGYRLLTATSGHAGLDLLASNAVQVVICDQRMPEMSGIDFLAQVKEDYPEIIRIVLTGYTDVDAITEAINKGHIYKFFLKPWDDHQLKIEIMQAFKHYDLIQSNRHLHQMVLEQNEELQSINAELEARVRQRTAKIEIQNKALELSRTILNHLSIPVIGISSDGIIVVANQEGQVLLARLGAFSIGSRVDTCFSHKLGLAIQQVWLSAAPQKVERWQLAPQHYNIDIVPLGGHYQGKGAVMVFKECEAA